MKVKTKFDINEDGSRTYTKIFRGRGVSCIYRETVWDNNSDECNDDDDIFNSFVIKKVEKDKKKADDSVDIIEDTCTEANDDLPNISVEELEDLRDNLFSILSKGNNKNKLFRYLLSMKEETCDKDVEKGKR